jgi:hypothetical protein
LIVTQSIQRLIDVITDEIVTDFFLPMVENMRADQVANIRFNVAQIIVKLLPHVSRAVYESRIKPIIEALLQDPDRDVVFFATKAQVKGVEVFP